MKAIIEATKEAKHEAVKVCECECEKCKKAKSDARKEKGFDGFRESEEEVRAYFEHRREDQKDKERHNFYMKALTDRKLTDEIRNLEKILAFLKAQQSGANKAEVTAEQKELDREYNFLKDLELQRKMQAWEIEHENDVPKFMEEYDEKQRQRKAHA